MTSIEETAGDFLEVHLAWEPDSPNEQSGANKRLSARPTDKFTLIVEDDRDVA